MHTIPSHCSTKQKKNDCLICTCSIQICVNVAGFWLFLEKLSGAFHLPNNFEAISEAALHSFFHPICTSTMDVLCQRPDTDQGSLYDTKSNIARFFQGNHSSNHHAFAACLIPQNGVIGWPCKPKSTLGGWCSSRPFQNSYKSLCIPCADRCKKMSFTEIFVCFVSWVNRKSLKV